MNWMQGWFAQLVVVLLCVGAMSGCRTTERADRNFSYMVLDISGGSSASKYPVRYLKTVPTGGWTDEYKTTKIVLWRIPAGMFTMGSPTNELGREFFPIDETQHQVTLSQDFYIGVFEVTQRQWELVTGNRPSWFTNASCRDTRPVECVSYDDIRGSIAGAKWPATNSVDAISFMGRLRARTSRMFDLPTEAQWEYACRAGTTTTLNSGFGIFNVDKQPRVAEVARYFYNGGRTRDRFAGADEATAKVGCYLPNAWGLFDMHGNVYEWCLDWHGAYPRTVSDPKGPLDGIYRVSRGGGWNTDAGNCRSAARFSYDPAFRGVNGLRLAAPTGR